MSDLTREQQRAVNELLALKQSAPKPRLTADLEPVSTAPLDPLLTELAANAPQVRPARTTRPKHRTRRGAAATRPGPTRPVAAPTPPPRAGLDDYLLPPGPTAAPAAAARRLDVEPEVKLEAEEAGLPFVVHAVGSVLAGILVVLLVVTRR